MQSIWFNRNNCNTVCECPVNKSMIHVYFFSLQARAIRERIGLSENIMNDTYLNEEYKEVSFGLQQAHINHLQNKHLQSSFNQQGCSFQVLDVHVSDMSWPIVSRNYSWSLPSPPAWFFSNNSSVKISVFVWEMGICLIIKMIQEHSPPGNKSSTFYDMILTTSRIWSQVLTWTWTS